MEVGNDNTHVPFFLFVGWTEECGRATLLELMTQRGPFFFSVACYIY